MKLRFFHFALLTVASIGVWNVLHKSEKVAVYQPRENAAEAKYGSDTQELYHKLRGNIETGKIEGADFQSMRLAVSEQDRSNKYKRSTDLSWFEMGPDNVGGRTRAILSIDEQTIFAGAISGGLWKSTDGANSWKKVNSFPASIVSRIARTGDGTLYVGTGSTFEGGNGNIAGEGQSAFLGSGLYMSKDNGENWTIVPGTEPVYMSNLSEWNAINVLAADPGDPTKVWIGGDAGFGYYKGTGSPIMNNISGLQKQVCQDISISKDGQTILLASGSARVYRSTNGGSSFSAIGSGTGDGLLPSGMRRSCVSIAPDDANICYASFSTPSGSMGGVYASEDRGATWRNIWPVGDPEFDPFGDNVQGFYDQALAAYPGRPDLVLMGGVTLWKVGLKEQAQKIAYEYNFGGSDLYVHADIHTFHWTAAGTLFIGCDGGIFKSADRGKSFRAVNRAYNVTQFYGIAHASDNKVLGGSQDNGSTMIYGDGRFISPQEGVQISGGDGFDCDITQANANDNYVVFTTTQYGNLMRFDQAGDGGNFYDDNINALANSKGEIGGFYSVVRLFEDTEDEDSQQYKILVNPQDSNMYSTIVYDASNNPIDTNWMDYNLPTKNLEIKFNYRLALGDTLKYWDKLVRTEKTVDKPLTEDPDYWWLPVQNLTETIINCDYDSIPVDTLTVIDEIIYMDSCITWLGNVYCEKLPIDTLYKDQIIWDISSVCDTAYFYASDIIPEVREQRKIQDTYTSMMTVGFNGSKGLWMTRDAIDMKTSPKWWKIVEQAPPSGVSTIEYSADGNHLFYASWNGGLARVSGLDALWDVDMTGLPADDDRSNLTEDIILNETGVAITGIAVDYNNPNHVVVTYGGYGATNTGKILESWNALAPDPDWNNVWKFSAADQELERMPCYDVIVDATDETGMTLVVATEFGIYTTDSGGRPGLRPNWVKANAAAEGSTNGIDDAPVFSLEQQQIGRKKWRVPENSGAIYAGAHGRGIFRADERRYVGVDDVEDDLVDLRKVGVQVYPNPVRDLANINLLLQAPENVSYSIYNINGALAISKSLGRYAGGNHQMRLDVSGLNPGNYIVHVQAGAASGVAKFIVLE